MCGICGIYNYKNNHSIDYDTIKNMSSVLNHRGPDEEGYFVDEHIGLGHKRLKIIDLETGLQPISNEDESIYIIFNGEIYNFKELRYRLQKNGHHFKTKSDTEVIIHLYEEMGIKCLNEINGMFAFALWDNNKRELILARDRIGQKPLYYFQQNGNFIFSSEIKSFLKISNLKLNIDNDAIVKYLRYSYVPPPITIFKNVNKLLPAHYLVVNKNGFYTKKYWELNFTNKTDLSYKECKQKLISLLTDATKIRMISDVPLGVFLSGGLDSSIIVALMKSISSGRIKTFSIGFKNKKYNELDYSRIVANNFRTEHYEFIVEPNILDILDNIVWYYDQPYADSSSIPTYYLSEMTKKYVTVALNGDGGDENFAGYPRYKAAYFYNILNKMPFKSHKIISGLLGNLLKYFPEGKNSKGFNIKLRKYLDSLNSTDKSFYENYHSWFCHYTKQMINNLLVDDIKNNINNNDEYLKSNILSNGNNDIIDSILYMDLMTYLPDDLLVKIDTATMVHSLEARSPFLDYRLIEFSASLKSDMKLDIFSSKKILRETFKNILPKHICRRPKMGFGVPIGDWLCNELKDFCVHTLTNKRVSERNILNINYVKQIINEHHSGKINHGYRLWNILMLELWFRRFIDNEENIC